MVKNTSLYEEFYLNEDKWAAYCFPKVRKVATPDFHKNLYRLLSDKSKRFVAIIAPRGHAKSTISTTFIPLHRMLFGEERNILIMSETEDQAKAHLDTIKDHLQNNEAIKELFPKLQFPKWTEERIVVKGGPFNIDCQIIVKGSKQKVRGLNYQQQRPTLVIMDDVEGEDNMSSQEIRNQLKNRIDAALVPSIDPKIGRIFMIGTIVHYDSYLNELWTKSDTPNQKVGRSGRWEYVFYRAIENYGTNNEIALWPEWRSLKDLHEERKELKRKGREYIWHQEYQNEPTAGDEQLFKPEYFNKRHDYHIQNIGGINWLCDKDNKPIRNCEVFIGVDPAISIRNRADHFAMCTMAVDHLGKKYIIDIQLKRLNSVMAQANLILNNAFNYHARSIAVETVAYQQALATQLRERMVESGRYYRIQEFKPRDSKNERLKNLEYPISQGRMIFPNHKHNQDPIFQTIEQFKSYPRGKHDDGMDAVYYADQICITPPKVATSQAIPKENKVMLTTVKEYNWKVL